MPYELDFLNVGDGERSGDAIAIRYLDADSTWKVMIVDGGDKAAGERLVQHVLTAYGTHRVDYVVNTHPDIDHASGLEVVMENLEVGELWVHRPWAYPEHVHKWCADGRFTVRGVRNRLQDAMGHAYQLEQIAARKRVPIFEPFQGSRIGNKFWVASPGKEWYQHLLLDFDKTPETKATDWMTLATMSAFGNGGGIIQNALRQTTLASMGTTLLGQTYESWDYETLGAGPTTSRDNESSVVLYGQLDENILLTGDAGVEALNCAMDWLQAYQIYPSQHVGFLQVPHHGSRHNVDPATLNRLLGPVLPIGQTRGIVAFVSAGATSDRPRKVVTNAFIRRGASVYAAKGCVLRHCQNVTARPGSGMRAWSPLPFSETVENAD